MVQVHLVHCYPFFSINYNPKLSEITHLLVHVSTTCGCFAQIYRNKIFNNFHVMFTLDILKSEVTECRLKQALLADLTKNRDIFKGKWIKNLLEKPCRNCGHPPEVLPYPHLDLNAGNSLFICSFLQSPVSQGTTLPGNQISNGKRHLFGLGCCNWGKPLSLIKSSSKHQKLFYMITYSFRF